MQRRNTTNKTVPNTKIKAVPPFLDDFFNFLDIFLSTLMEVEIELRKAKPRNEELKKLNPKPQQMMNMDKYLTKNT